MTKDLKDVFEEGAARIEDAYEAPHLRQVRQIQEELAEALADARAVPARLKALESCRSAAATAIESLSDPRFVHASLGLRLLIESTLSRARQLVKILNEGSKYAAERVARIENLTYERVSAWSPREFIRCQHDELRSIAAMPDSVKAISDTLAGDLEEISRRLRFDRVEPRGATFAPPPDDPAPAQAHARSRSAERGRD